MNQVVLLGNVEDVFPQDSATTIHLLCVKDDLFLF